MRSPTSPTRRDTLPRTLALPLLVLALAACDDATTPADMGTTIPTGVDITTAQGPVHGAESGGTRAFLGIPFAAPPTGDNRFKPPQPATPWTAARDATKRGPACPQFNAITGAYDDKTSEDCLTLNVWTPAAPKTLRPVMVWIHGGGYILGSGGEDTYDGANLSAAGDVVVVTLNYRLGPLGFLAHAALDAEDPQWASSGNYGLLDQQRALVWVKDNIAQFGGDAANVTIFGESAGGMSVCAQLVAPGARGLFHRAIIESGPCVVLAMPDKATWEAQGEALGKALGCTGDAGAIRSCLRAKSAREVLTALPRRTELIFGDGASWNPYIDGKVIVDRTVARLGAGEQARVPVMIGANKDEGTLFFALGAKADTYEELRATLGSIYPGPVVDQVMSHYQGQPSAHDAALAILGDAFVCDARRMARTLAGAGQPVFYYHFTRAFQWVYPDLGAFHSAELPFVFGNAYVFFNLKDEELPLSRAMQGYWTRFATTGNPNTGAPAGAVDWPAYDAAGDRHLQLDLAITTGTGLRKDACDFWDGLVK